MNRKNKWGHVSRRKFVKVGAGALGVGALAAKIGYSLVFPDRAVAQKSEDTSPQQALKKLMEGNQRFVTRKRIYPDQSVARFKEVAQEQKPFAAILTCSDSRVTPDIIFDEGLGDLFVVRNAGNVVTPQEIGSLEYGTLIAGAKVVMILGHKRCGAVEAAIKGAPVPGQISSLIESIAPAIESSEGQTGSRINNAVKANVLLQAQRLESSPVISQLIQSGKLQLVGGYYDLDTGAVTIIT